MDLTGLQATGTIPTHIRWHVVTFLALIAGLTYIDRLNLGPVPTIKLNWLQPHEGSIVDFLFRARAFQHEGPVNA